MPKATTRTWFFILPQSNLEQNTNQFMWDCPENVGLLLEEDENPVPRLLDWYKDEMNEALDENEKPVPGFHPRFWYWKVGNTETFDIILEAAETDIRPYRHHFTYVQEIDGGIITHKETQILHQLLNA